MVQDTDQEKRYNKSQWEANEVGTRQSKGILELQS